MLDKNKIPKHIAIIMDGNGRWAKKRGLLRTQGHRAGIKSVEETVKAAAKLGVQQLTFFVFSSENWSRPAGEIKILMRYLGNFLDKKISDMSRQNIRFIAIGREKPLSAGLIAKIKQAEDKTRQNNGLTVVLALNYGARQEIVDAAKKFARRAANREVSPEDLSEDSFSGYLYTAGLADPDLLIRTSGEMRLSNFMLWQLSYTELYFCEKYWPDFKAADLKEAVLEYQKRQRRFGGL